MSDHATTRQSKKTYKEISLLIWDPIKSKFSLTADFYSLTDEWLSFINHVMEAATDTLGLFAKNMNIKIDLTIIILRFAVRFKQRMRPMRRFCAIQTLPPCITVGRNYVARSSENSVACRTTSESRRLRTFRDLLIQMIHISSKIITAMCMFIPKFVKIC